MPPTPYADRPSAKAINAVVSAVQPANANAGARAAMRQQKLTKPPGSLGLLEALAIRIAAMTGTGRPRLEQRLIVVAAADHGVAVQGVSAYPQEVTAQMVTNFLAGGAAINVLANHAGARVRVVNAGVVSMLADHAELVSVGLPRGSADITRGPAMSQVTAERAIAAGIDLLQTERDVLGVDIVACGEMGIGNSTAAAALVAAASGQPALAVTGRGTGIDDDAYQKKLWAVEAALEVNKPSPEDGVSLLAALGGHEIGVLAGVYLAAAAARIPVVMDGMISGAAALVATAIAPDVRDYIVAGHRSVEPGHHTILEMLELEPLLDLRLRLGEGSGAALGLSLCVAACRLLDEMATFDEAGVADTGDAVASEA